MKASAAPSSNTVERAKSSKVSAPERSLDAAPPTINPLWMSLATQVQRKCDGACANADDDSEDPPTVQLALELDRPGDVHEREADAVAEAVVDGSTPPGLRARPASAGPAEHRGIGDASAPVPLALARAGRGGGEPVPRTILERVEPVLQTDLGHVRIHRDSEADRAARALGARAFTHRSGIWLRSNERPTDLRLMAHELTHTVQQGAAPTRSPRGLRVQRSCDSVVRGEGLVRDEEPSTSPSASTEEEMTQRGRRHASVIPPGAQRRDIAEQVRERERARDTPDQIGPAPLSGIIVRAPPWPFLRRTSIPLVEWETSTGMVSFVTIPIPELLTSIDIGGQAHARANVEASYGAGGLRNIELGLTPHQALLFNVGSMLGFGPDADMSMLRLFGDFRGRGELYIPASINAEFGVGASLRALAELLGVIDLASIHGGLEANAHARADLEFRGQVYIDYIDGELSFSYHQALPLRVNLGFDLDAVVGGSFGIWPLNYEWEKRWKLLCWRWMRQWELTPRLALDYNRRAGVSAAGAFDPSEAFVVDLEDLPVDDFLDLLDDLLEDEEPGELDETRSDEVTDTPLNIRWPYELPLPPRQRPLVRRGSGEYDDDSRGSVQNRVREEILERVRRGLPLDDIACDNRLNDGEPFGAFDAHHMHPLAFGGQDQEYNLCALRLHLHERGHRKLRFQRDMVGRDSTWINAGVTEPDLYRHPSGQWYTIISRK